MLKARGFSLIELLVSMVIGLLILFGVLTIFTNNLTTSSAQIEQMKLQQQMRNTMDLMSNEIRRAGYWGKASSQIANDPTVVTNLNPFSAIDTSGPTCITFSYDESGPNGTEPPDGILQDREIIGFKAEAGVILVRKPEASASKTCSGSTGWQAITDINKINVTGLTFSLETKDCGPSTNTTDSNCIGNQKTNYVSGTGVKIPTSVQTTIAVRSRAVTISFFAELAKDNSIKSELTEEVRIRNDQIKY